MATFISASVAETEAAGSRIAPVLGPNDVIALCGDLGAGKTHFVKGIARGLGASDAVTSPTFTLMHEYRGGRLPVFHFDFYRLENMAAVPALGWDEYLEAGGVTVVEWADRFTGILPPSTKWIRLQMLSPEKRAIDLGVFG